MKFELFEGLFQKSLKIHNQLTEEDRVNYFHSPTRGDAAQTFKNITSPNRENLVEILTVFRKKYVEPQSMAAVKHKFKWTVFNPANQMLIDSLDELQKLPKDAFGVATRAILEQFIYAKMRPPEEIDQPVVFGEWLIPTVCVTSSDGCRSEWFGSPRWIADKHWTQQATQQNPGKPNQTCHHFKKTGHYWNHCRQLKPEKDQARNNTNSADKNNTVNSDKTNSSSKNKIPNNTNKTIQTIKKTEKIDLCIHLVRPVV